ncbi:hypothetical protein NPIL_572081 [Nephila pilipes]|uniref:Uncharacterized protein n=1 Tax=Nephila pilipes TaxID=299642 RepID=A0A8X6MY40_NEPPI|nr:hypothetical protein NPIL_572081 [Nephila pilipes]
MCHLEHWRHKYGHTHTYIFTVNAYPLTTVRTQHFGHCFSLGVGFRLSDGDHLTPVLSPAGRKHHVPVSQLKFPFRVGRAPALGRVFPESELHHDTFPGGLRTLENFVNAKGGLLCGASPCQGYQSAVKHDGGEVSLGGGVGHSGP